MDAVLDTLWEYLAAGFQFLGESLFSVLQHIHFLGPFVLITFLALTTVAITKILNRVIITKRYIKLEKKFNYWVQVRDEATKCEDREKGKRMARNIDQAELNRAYYDYFFEGLLLGLARRIIPIFFMFAFINEFYRPESMLEIFGRQHVLQIPSSGGEPILVGTVFCYFISLLTGYILWFIVGKLFRRFKAEPLAKPVETEELPNCSNC
ncbi:MAG: hypothetical protein GY799_17700 [Desulfobulbaceae bacterium]|nr:hypothetical protein [Desulfobulbaceae bacterium]